MKTVVATRSPARKPATRTAARPAARKPAAARPAAGHTFALPHLLSGPGISLERTFELLVFGSIAFAVIVPITVFVLPGLFAAAACALVGLVVGMILGIRPGILDLPIVGPAITIGGLIVIAIAVPLAAAISFGLLSNLVPALGGLACGLVLAARYHPAPTSSPASVATSSAVSVRP